MAQTTATDLGIDLSEGKPREIFRWFLASLLFGRPLQQGVAAKTYETLEEHGLTAPEKFAEHDREQLRKILDEGGYGRFDYQMTDALHATMAAIDDEYGSVADLVKKADDRADLERKLQKLKGIGPKVTEIFLRDLPDRFIGSA